MARPAIAEYLQLPSFEPGPGLRKLSQSQRGITPGGVVYSNLEHVRRQAGVRIPVISPAEKTEIETMFDTVGNALPVYAVLWEDSLDYYGPLHAIIDDEELGFDRDDEGNYSTEITLREVR
jgi:hypothetical protein